MKLNYFEIGNRIRYIREELKLSQIAFAEMIGVSREHIGRIERNPKQPSLDVLTSISYYTGYSVDYILFGRDNHYQEVKREMNKAEMVKIIKEMNTLLEKL